MEGEPAFQPRPAVLSGPRIITLNVYYKISLKLAEIFKKVQESVVSKTPLMQHQLRLANHLFCIGSVSDTIVQLQNS
jgi:hypothetical protein